MNETPRPRKFLGSKGTVLLERRVCGTYRVHIWDAKIGDLADLAAACREALLEHEESKKCR